MNVSVVWTRICCIRVALPMSKWHFVAANGKSGFIVSWQLRREARRMASSYKAAQWPRRKTHFVSLQNKMRRGANCFHELLHRSEVQQKISESSWIGENLAEARGLTFSLSAFAKLYFGEPEMCVFIVDSLIEVSRSRQIS